MENERPEIEQDDVQAQDPASTLGQEKEQAPEPPETSRETEVPTPEQPEASKETEVPTPEQPEASTTVQEQASAATEEGDKAESSALEQLKPGVTMKGRVRNVVEFGAFIDIGVGRDGLAHISTLKRAGIDKEVKVGDVIDVVVRRVDLDNNRISLSVPRADRETKVPLNEVPVGEVITGRVMRLVDFGAFVDIGAQTDGLLHVSQLSRGHVNHPSEVLNVGDELQVRVLEVDLERRRVSLSLRDVEAEGSNGPYEQAASAAPAGPSREPVAQRQQNWERPPVGARQSGGERSSRGGGSRSSRGAAPRSTFVQAPQNEEQAPPEDGLPTAMEMAFQEALRRRRRNRS